MSAKTFSRTAVGGFDVGDQPGAEHLLAPAHTLQRDPVAVENRFGRLLFESVGAAIDVERRTVDRYRAAGQYHLAGFDAIDATHPHDVADAPQLLQFGLRHVRAAVNRRLRRLIQPEKVAAGFQAFEQVRHGCGGLDRNQPVGEAGLEPLQELRAGAGCWPDPSATRRAA